LAVALILVLAGAAPGDEPPGRLAPPVEDGPFLRPAPGDASEPVWGIKGGIAVGLWPTPGPRGLLRVYAPYLGQGRRQVINFVAVEPIVGRARGLSELEPSALDGVAGKAMWSADSPDDGAEPRAPWRPARGRIGGEPGARSLTFRVLVEPFDNGARPIVEVTLREDRPHEVAFRLFAAPGGEPMRACVLTATMGNYARLRTLRLADGAESASRLWPDDEPDDWGFYPHRAWPASRMLARDGEAIAAAVPDEERPEDARYDAGVSPFWRYRGRVATQYWRAPLRDGLVVRVNGRRTYWGSDAPIPGGVAFENFELEAPFEPGQRLVFGVSPGGPGDLGFGR
jgi:hypothetical protein